MRAVLITFSIDLTDAEIDQLMDDFGGGGDELLVRREGCCEMRLEVSDAAICLSGRDAGDGLGKTIRYQDFVIAVDTVGSRHPLQINSGRFFTDLKARYLKDTDGRRLCTPGESSPASLLCGQGRFFFSFHLHEREI